MKVEAHPLSNDPDQCYEEFKRLGRYNNLAEHDTSSNLERKPNSIRFVCISDTHVQTDSFEQEDFMPEGDVLLHTGDFTINCRRTQIEHFNDFLGKIKHKYRHVVVIAGNHDVMFDSTWNNKRLFGRKVKERIPPEEAKSMLTNCTYIEDELIELYGIRIYGSPWQPEFEDLGFNEIRGEDILEIWDKIPDETDVLMTHGPPLGIGDLCSHGARVGCAELLTTIQDRVKPKYHIFGHIHEDYGKWTDGETTYINASMIEKDRTPRSQPIVFDYELHTN